MNINKVIIGGRLVADPELRQTTQGASACRVTIAVDRNPPKNGGETATDFFDVSAFDKRAELLARKFRKGSRILIVGRLQQRRWETKSGEKRQTVEINPDEIHFVDKYDPYDAEQPVVSVPGKPDPVKYDSPAYNGGKDTGTSGFVDIPADGELPF